MKKKISKKVMIISAVILCVLIAVGVGVWYKVTGGLVADEDKVYVESVAKVAGLTGVNGSQNRYTGVVESQDTHKVEKDSETKVKEIKVKVGDTVEVGTELFTYDVEDLQNELDLKNLEVEKERNEISEQNNQIKDAQALKSSASADGQFEYTVIIHECQTAIKQAEYNIATKEKEAENLTKKIESASEKSEIAGVIKTINATESSDENSEYSSGSDDGSFMTILATGNYRVKGIVSEQTATTSLSEGASVIIRSRIDEATTWKGTIEKVDFDNPVQNTSNEYYGEEETASNSATKVPFYVALEDTEGLMMGQHLFIELDMGQGEEQEGLWLTGSYIVNDGETAYAWVSNKYERLEKRIVTLGEYNEELDKYQIIEGLAEEDLIAFPQESFQEGMSTTTLKVMTESEEEDTFEDSGEEGEIDMGQEEILPEDELMDEAISEDTVSEDETGELEEETESGEVQE